MASGARGRRLAHPGDSAAHRLFVLQSPTRTALDRDRYLTTDFGDALASLKPLKLDLEFPSPTQSISLRLPREVLNKIRIIADEQDVPYQSLIKMWLVERLKTG